MKAARVYAERLRWAVLPLHDVTRGVCSCGVPDCRSAGKHPRLSEWESKATNDLATVDGWIAQYPTANVGVATGTPSGFFALDIDPDKGGDESLTALEAQHGKLPTTAQAKTGSGGRHFLFKMPPGVDLRNTSNKVGKGIDTRGSGGQIVVAPSRSLKGAYTWVAPPWSTELADAPAWLLHALTAAPPGRPVVVQSDRGFFPPPSEPVLDEAREALRRHGPAIDGQGGGLHTVHAAAILTHDFALTEDEAWPLFTEWNETCTPPWELEGAESLRVMLGRGLKYGKGEFGSRRQLDAVEAARKVVKDWIDGGSDPTLAVDTAERVRQIAKNSGDPLRRELIEREVIERTGWTKTAVALPRVKHRNDDETAEGTIEVTPRLHEVADKAVKAIEPHVFQRHGELCEVVSNDATVIRDLEVARIQDLMSLSARWVRYDAQRGETIEQAPPLPVAAILKARHSHRGVREIVGVTTSPIFLADGSILRARGYDPQAKVFLEPSVYIDVPDAPTQDDARAAVALFADLLCNYHFSTPADFSVWVAGLLSPLCKAATKNALTPLICVSASSPGAGKSMLAELVALIVMGRNVESRSYTPRDPVEWGKRLTAYVREGSPVASLDNIEIPLGDEKLNQLLTSVSWSDRTLGTSDAPAVTNVTTWFANGNNLEPTRDIVRRVLFCRLEVDTERPQDRSDLKRPMLKDYALEHRAEYLTAALTILRAFHVAGRPDQRLPSWGSFETWSHLVRNAIVWAGLEDPHQTQVRASNEMTEPDLEQLEFWIEVVEASDGTPAGICQVANTRDAASVIGMRESHLTPLRLKKFLNRHLDRPRGGKKIRRETGRSGHFRYFVERVG